MTGKRGKDPGINLTNKITFCAGRQFAGSARDSLKNHRECERARTGRGASEKGRNCACGRGHRDVAEIIGKDERFTANAHGATTGGGVRGGGGNDGEKFSSAPIESCSCDLSNTGEKERGER
jgi:hypothetical protein